MNRMAFVLLLSLAFILFGAVQALAAHTHAHVAISDGQTSDSDSDDDWGVTCSSQANETLDGASASSGASVTWDTSHPFFISKTCSTWTNTCNTSGFQSSHSPTYAKPYDFNVRLYGENAVAGCLLWLDSIDLVVPVGSPDNYAIANFNIVVDGTSLARGYFLLAGDGSHYGEDAYIDSFFDVYLDGDFWHGEYLGPPELAVDLPANTQLECDFLVTSYANVILPAASRSTSTHTVTFGVPEEFTLVDHTVAADIDCQPDTGVVPFSTLISVNLDNLYPLQVRRIAGRMNVTLGNGTYFANWRAGFTNVAAGDSYFSSWPQTLPMLATVIGDNIFELRAEDITPAPFNQPPYPPAGDTATSFCVVTANAP